MEKSYEREQKLSSNYDDIEFVNNLNSHISNDDENQKLFRKQKSKQRHQLRRYIWVDDDEDKNKANKASKAKKAPKIQKTTRSNSNLEYIEPIILTPPPPPASKKIEYRKVIYFGEDEMKDKAKVVL